MEDRLALWLIIIAAGVTTYAFRLSFIVLAGQAELPRLVQRALRFVPAAALSAIILPELVLREGAANLSLGNARLLAGLAAMLVAWYTRNVLITIVVGMAALWLVQALL